MTVIGEIPNCSSAPWRLSAPLGRQLDAHANARAKEQSLYRTQCDLRRPAKMDFTEKVRHRIHRYPGVGEGVSHDFQASAEEISTNNSQDDARSHGPDGCPADSPQRMSTRDQDKTEGCTETHDGSFQGGGH